MNKVILLILALFISNNIFNQDKTLKLVYKDAGKIPYMAPAPDNSGLYLELMTKAAKNIGFNIEVIRQPKVRTYQLLETGEADIYASGEFRDYRSEFLFYFENGLYRKEDFYGLTSIDIPELSSISDINKYGLTWVFELGCSWPIQAKAFNVDYIEIVEGRQIEKAIDLLKKRRPFFFKFTPEEIDEYKKINKIENLNIYGIKVHKNCCDSNNAPLYTGFSRNSKYYKEQINPLYNKDKKLSAENFPVELVPGSVPYMLKKSLEQMIENGEVNLLIKKYLNEE